jgi:hypothetical protein
MRPVEVRIGEKIVARPAAMTDDRHNRSRNERPGQHELLRREGAREGTNV